MFRDDHHLARCCRALCARMRLASAWTLDGPSRVAFDVRDGRSPLSSGERTIVRAAWSIWNGDGGRTLAELGILDVAHTAAIFELVLAATTSTTAIDAWAFADPEASDSDHCSDQERQKPSNRLDPRASVVTPTGLEPVLLA